MQVMVYDDIENVPGQDWDDVITRSAAPVFYRHRYLLAHARSGVSTPLASRFVIVRASRTGPALAVCPATVQQPADPLGVLTANVAGFAQHDRCLLSHVWQCYDTVLPAIDPAAARCAADSLAELARDAAAQWYGFVNVGEASMAGIRHALGPAAVTAEIDERFRMDLSPLSTFDDYLATLTRNPARNLRRYLRRAADRSVTVARRPAQDAALDEAISLIRVTAERHGNTGMYPDGPFQNFVRRLGELVVAVEIRDRGRLVGVGLCLLDEQRFHLWTAGAAEVDEALYSSYGLVFAEAMRAAVDSGKTVLEGGRRNREYKERHGLVRVPLHAVLARTGPDPDLTTPPARHEEEA